MRGCYLNTERATEVTSMGNPVGTMSERTAGLHVAERVTVALLPSTVVASATEGGDVPTWTRATGVSTEPGVFGGAHLERWPRELRHEASMPAGYTRGLKTLVGLAEALDVSVSDLHNSLSPHKSDHES